MLLYLVKRKVVIRKTQIRIGSSRSFILLTYLITNCFIANGVIRHWNTEGKTLSYMCQEERNMRRSCTLVSENQHIRFIVDIDSLIIS